MWTAIRLAIAALLDLCGITAWLKERADIQEGKYDQQFADAKQSLKEAENAKEIDDTVRVMPLDDVNRFLHANDHK